MPAEIEEIVVRPIAIDPSTSLQIVGELRFMLGLAVPPVRPAHDIAFGLRQRVAVDLAVRRHRQLPQRAQSATGSCSPAGSARDEAAQLGGARHRRAARRNRRRGCARPSPSGQARARRRAAIARMRGERAPRLPRARCGSRGSSPDDRCGRGIRSCRRARKRAEIAGAIEPLARRDRGLDEALAPSDRGDRDSRAPRRCRRCAARPATPTGTGLPLVSRM